MKNITAAVLLLLFVFSTKSCYLKVANAASQPVLDSDGDELLRGVNYYVVSAIHGSGGGGLDLGRSKTQKCPAYVVQHAIDTQIGRPVQFYPVNGSDSVVHLSTNVRIVFFPGQDVHCRIGTGWELDNYDFSSGKYFVKTGTLNGGPGPQTLNSWFKIKKSDYRFYKLTFCPLVSDWCNDLTRYSYNKQLRLGLTRQNGWPFVFIKASKAKQQAVETPFE